MASWIVKIKKNNESKLSVKTSTSKNADVAFDETGDAAPFPAPSYQLYSTFSGQNTGDFIPVQVTQEPSAYLPKSDTFSTHSFSTYIPFNNASTLGSTIFKDNFTIEEYEFGSLDMPLALQSFQTFSNGISNLSLQFNNTPAAEISVLHSNALLFDSSPLVPSALATVDDSYDTNEHHLGTLNIKDFTLSSVEQLVVNVPVSLDTIGSVIATSLTPESGELARFEISVTDLFANNPLALDPGSEPTVEIPAILVIQENGDVILTKNTAFDFLPDGSNIDIDLSYTLSNGDSISNTFTIEGSDNMDVVIAKEGGEALDTAEKSDLVIGSIGDDYLDAGDGWDVVYGGLGTDTIIGDGGFDYLIGDVVNLEDYQDASQTVGAGDDSLYGGDGKDTLIGDAEDLKTGALGGDDLLDGGSWDDIIMGDGISMDGATGGADTIYGQTGIDYLYGDATTMEDSTGGADYISAGEYHDHVYGDASVMTSSTGGNDQLYGEGGKDTLYGDAHTMTTSQGGDDLLDGGAWNDTMYGDAKDMTQSTGGNDTLLAGAGNDTLYGDGQTMTDSIGGDDILHGGDGKDTLYGDAETSTNSTGGEDTLYGGGNDDTLYGGEGDDILYGDNDPTSSEADGEDILYGEDGDDTLDGGGSADSLYGGSGDDSLWFDVADTVIDGGDDEDTLFIDGSFDFTTLHGIIENIEIFDLQPNSHLTVDSAFVAGLTSETYSMRVDGNNTEQVTFEDTFTDNGPVSINGHDYTAYTNGNDTIYIDTDITVIMP